MKAKYFLAGVAVIVAALLVIFVAGNIIRRMAFVSAKHVPTQSDVTHQGPGSTASLLAHNPTTTVEGPLAKHTKSDAEIIEEQYALHGGRGMGGAPPGSTGSDADWAANMAASRHHEGLEAYGENSGLDQPPFDPASLGGVYTITLTPDDKKMKTETWEFDLNVQQTSPSNVSVNAALVDSAGMAVNASSGYPHVNPMSRSMDFRLHFQFFTFTYTLDGTVHQDGTITGKYTYGSFDPVITGKTQLYPGTLTGTRLKR